MRIEEYASLEGYEVTDNGEVYSSKTKRLRKLYKSDSTFGNQYLAFSIRRNKKPTKVWVHRLVAFQKFGDSLFQPGIVVRHLNTNNFDNSWNNIGIGTQYQNMQDTKNIAESEDFPF